MKTNGTLHIDAHVHLYEGYDLAATFDRVLDLAGRLRSPLFLLLTETAGFDYFGALRSRAATAKGSSLVRSWAANLHDPTLDRFEVAVTAESTTLGVRRRDEAGPVAYLVAGRQFISVERIEVLALGLAPESEVSALPDGAHPADAILARVLEAGAAAVLPWSFGKWVGARGKRVSEIAARPQFREHGLFFLGDIAARCAPWPPPPVFAGPARILCGSDPLPFSGAERGIARYRCTVEGTADPSRPAGMLLEILRSGRAVRPEGRRAALLPTLANQVRLRFRRKS